jgi:hypothetical protein
MKYILSVSSQTDESIDFAKYVQVQTFFWRMILFYLPQDLFWQLRGFLSFEKQIACLVSVQASYHRI